MVAAHGEEIVEIGSAAVSPPGDVMQLAPVVPDRAAGDRTRGVQPPQRPPLRTVGEAGGATEVEPAESVEYHAIADHDRLDRAVAHHLGQHPMRHLDRDTPVDRRPGRTIGR